MRLDNRFELELPPAPDTPSLKVARSLCVLGWSLAAVPMLLGVRAALLGQPSKVFMAFIIAAVLSTLLTILVARLHDGIDARYWTEARIRQRHYRIWRLAFDVQQPLGRRP